MKLNVKQTLKTLQGEPLNVVDEKGKKIETLTLGTVLSNIILAPHKDKNGFRPLKAYELAQKFVNQKEVDIDTSEMIQLKEIVENNESYMPLITAQAILMLNAIKE